MGKQHNYVTLTELFYEASPKIEEELIWKSNFIWDHLQCHRMKFSAAARSSSLRLCSLNLKLKVI